MKTILHATDFSSTAENAAFYAAEMANVIHADLHLLHVSEIPAGYVDVALAVNLDIKLKDSEEAIEYLKSKLLMKYHNLHISTTIKQGMFKEELNALSEIIHPYCVVIGSKGKTFTESLVYGNHAVHTMKHSRWPVIAIPHTVRFKNIKHIVLASDFNDVIETTPVDEIKSLVLDFNATLHIINTGNEDISDPQKIYESGMLQEMLDQLHPKYHNIRDEFADEGILNYCDNNNVDLLIVIPKRHTLVERIIRKSHTKNLVLHSHVPVMAMHNNL